LAPHVSAPTPTTGTDVTSRALIVAIAMIIASGVLIRIIRKVQDLVFTKSDVYEQLEKKRLNAHIAEMEMELGIIPKTTHFFDDGSPVPAPPLPLTKGSASWNYHRGTVSGGPR
jgi:hypothetical protein